MKDLESKLIDGWLDLNRVFRECSEYGADDTEPQANMEIAIATALDGEEFKGYSANKWELLTYSMKCNAAAIRLNAATKKFCNIILNAKIKDREIIASFLRSKLWRVTL